MIPARKNRLLDALFYRYLLRKLGQRFHGVHLRGAEHLAPGALPAGRAVLACANHTGWWDLLMLFRLTREIPKSCYGMMEEKNLRQYSFFRAIGGFSVDLENRIGAALGLRYAARLLRDPGNLVWVFPQGRLATPHEPVEVLPGLPFLARLAPEALILPVAFRYEFFRDDLPVALIGIGAPFPAAGADAEALRAALQREADALAAACRERSLNGFIPLSRPRLPINKKWEWLVRAATGRLAGFQAGN